MFELALVAGVFGIVIIFALLVDLVFYGVQKRLNAARANRSMVQVVRKGVL